MLQSSLTPHPVKDNDHSILVAEFHGVDNVLDSDFPFMGEPRSPYIVVAEVSSAASISSEYLGNLLFRLNSIQHHIPAL